MKQKVDIVNEEVNKSIIAQYVHGGFFGKKTIEGLGENAAAPEN